MRQLLNLLDANRGRGSALRAETKGDEATVYVYDAIGMWGIEASPFVAAVRGISASRLNLRINSPGGDVFDARAMAAALNDFEGHITAHVDGLSASAASFLMMAADEIVMADGAFVMIHNAWGLTMGNAEEHRGQAALLDKVDGAIVADYVARTKKPEAEIREMMAAETWFTAQEAVDAGFADRVAENSRAAKAQWNLSAYARAPAALLAPASNKSNLAAALAERDHYDARLRLFERPA